MSKFKQKHKTPSPLKRQPVIDVEDYYRGRLFGGKAIVEAWDKIWKEEWAKHKDRKA